jgi:hypothetical protein
MVTRSTGTVTFLFTDIEGSTRRWEAEPDAMRVALASHDDILRGAIEGRGGWVFKHSGDGMCAAFASPRGAVEAAIEAQQILELPVRMGLTTGEAELRGDDYFGQPLNGPGEPALGQRAYPGRTAQTRHRGQRQERPPLPASGETASAIAVLADLPAQPRSSYLGSGLPDGADPWPADLIHLLLRHTRAAAELGIQTLLTPVHAPKANAIAERLVGTLRRECLDHLIVFNERHLFRLLREYVVHYNEARPHRALQLEPPAGAVQLRFVSGGWVIAHPVLGGLLYEYERKAA